MSLTSPQRAAHPVLIVDDDFDVRESIGEVLEEEGYPVAMAAQGQEAIDLLQGGLRPCLILLDLMMPLMDGFEFCSIWRNDAELSAIPVLIVSADASCAQKAAECGATGQLAKPVQLETLLDTVARYARVPAPARS